MKKYILLTIIIFAITTMTANASILDWVKGLFNSNLGTALRVLTIEQGGSGTSTAPASGQILIGNGSGGYIVDNFSTYDTRGGGGGTTTTIAGLQPPLDIFFLTSTSGIVISTSSPATIRFNLDIATTTQLAITGLAGQSGCLSVDANGKVATSTCSGGTGITSLGGQTGGTQTFSTSTDTNIQLRIVSSANDHQFAPVWAGTLADSRITSANTWNAKITTTSLSVAYAPLAYNNTTGVFTLPTSTASQSGFLSSGDWTTFNAKQSALTFPLAYASTTHTTATTPLIITSGVLSMPTSTDSQNGFLLSTDWTTFNNKQATISFPIPVASTSLTASLPLLITTNNLSLTGRLSTINNITTSTGSLIVGKNDTTGWYGLAAGADNLCLVASSTATYGLGFQACATGGTGISSLNGLTASTQTFATSTGLASINISSSGSQHTISIGANLDKINSIATSTGNLLVASSTGWQGLTAGTSGKVLTASSTASLGVSWETSASGGDNITVEGTVASNANFSSSTPAAPTGSVNVQWQKDSANPDNISAYLEWGDYLLNAIRKRYIAFTDMLTIGLATLDPFIGSVILSGTIVAPNAGIATSSHPGIIKIRSSTTANSGMYIGTGTNNGTFLLGGGETAEAIINITTSTNGTFRFGFHDATTVTAPVDGVFIGIDSEGTLQGFTANNSASSTTATSYTVSVATWYRLKVVLNSNATTANYYIYNDAGTELWTSSLSANIPTASGREVGVALIATNSGTTATDLLHADYMAMSINRNLSR